MFNENSFFEKRPKIEAIKSEHLENGFFPIITSFGEKEHHNKFADETGFREIIKNASRVDYYEDHEILDEQGSKNAGDMTYVISKIDESSKISHGYHDCTGIVIVGIDKDTGKNISLMTHQFPGSFLNKDRDSFINDISDRLKKINESSITGSIDVTIFGGNAFKFNPLSKREYIQSIELLSDLVESELGFSPVVATGPKTISGHESVLFDTEKRHLYIGRDDVAASYKLRDPYSGDEVNDRKEIWFENKNH